MNGASAMKQAYTARRIARLGARHALLLGAVGAGIAHVQALLEAPAMLNAVDFVNQANLGAGFQVDSGRIAETTSTNGAVRSYAHLNAILKRENVTPSNALLHGAPESLLYALKVDHDSAFDRNYVNGQVEYQKAKPALFKQESHNGSYPDLKHFVHEALPRIESHFQLALKLAAGSGGGGTSN
jgi:putative membrane protein